MVFFSHFLNCRNGTKSRNAPHFILRALQKYKKCHNCIFFYETLYHILFGIEEQGKSRKKYAAGAFYSRWYLTT